MQSILDRYQKLTFISSLVLLFISILIITVYQFDISSLKNIFFGKQLSNPVTALCFFLSVISLYGVISEKKTFRFAGKIIGFLILIAGAVRFIESFTPFTSGIDRLLYANKLIRYGNDGKPNLMAPIAAFLFSLLGLSLVFYRYRINKKNLIADFLAFGVTVLSFLCIAGFVYNSIEFYRVKTSMPMAFPTAVSFFLISNAILFTRSAFGFFSLFTRKYIGSKIARFLIPFAIVVPVAGGILQLYGEKLELIPNGFAKAIFDTLNVLILILLIWRCCLYLNKENKAFTIEMNKRIQAEEAARLNESFLNTLIENLPEMIFVKDQNHRFVRINKVTEDIVGISRKELLGKTDHDFFPKEQADHFVRKDDEVFRSRGLIVVTEEKIGTNANVRWLHTKKIVIEGADGQRYLLGISQDITERKKMDEELREFNRQLEEKVLQRTWQLKEKEAEKRLLEKSLMEEKIHQQKMLMQATIDGQEKEKKQIGMELHDNINQILASIKLYIEMAQTDEKLRDQMLEKSKGQINSVINEIRNLSKSLVPHGIETGGLKEGITEIVETITRSKGIQFNTCINQSAIEKLDHKQQITLFRIIQEQLNNIVKHAQAKTVGVTLNEDNGGITLTIQDDGSGFDVNNKRAGIGLSNIKSRIELLGGNMELVSGIGMGCRLQVWFYSPESKKYSGAFI